MSAGRLQPLSFTTFAVAAVVLSAVASPAPARPVRTDHARAELVANVQSVAPGDTFWVALKLIPDDGWHVYWSNPGDAGLPPRLEWTLPEGWQAGPLQFPWPERFETPPLASYGYKDEVWYPVRIIVPSGEEGRVSGALSETSAQIRARATWLICREECLPEEADLELTLTFDTGVSRPDATHTADHPANAIDEKAWAAALGKLPVVAPDWNWRAEYGETSLQISWDVPPGSNPGEVLFFPADQGVITHAAPQSLRREGSRAVLTVDRDPVLRARPDTLRGVLVAVAGWPDSTGNPRHAAVTVDIDARESPTGGESGGGTALIIGLLALAFLVLIAVLKRPHLQRQRNKP